MSRPFLFLRAAHVLPLAFVLATAVAHADDTLPKAEAGSALWRELQAAVQLAGGLEVKANQGALREGQSLVLTIQVPRAGYLNVLSVDADGTPTVLFPNQLQADNKVAPGRFTLPNAQMPFELKASAPYGTSMVTAFLTQEPLNLYATGEGARNAAGVLLDRFARLSSAGRDLIRAVTTKTLVVVPAAGPAPALPPMPGSAARPASAPAAPASATAAADTPMLAGMVAVNVCGASGKCDPPGGRGGTSLLRVLDALVPGIFLDPTDKAYDDTAAPLRPVAERGIRLTKLSEGFVPRLYEDAAGYCTIAYGHLMRLGRCGRAERQRYPQRITEPEGGRLLVGDMAKAQRAVMALVKADLTDGQYAALVDFTFNVGAGNFRKSTLLKVVNARQHDRVPFQFRRWVMAGGRPLPGLVSRREREIFFFFEGRAVPKDLPAGEDTTPLDVRRGEP